MNIVVCTVWLYNVQMQIRRENDFSSIVMLEFELKYTEINIFRLCLYKTQPKMPKFCSYAKVMKYIRYIEEHRRMYSLHTFASMKYSIKMHEKSIFRRLAYPHVNSWEKYAYICLYELLKIYSYTIRSDQA